MNQHLISLPLSCLTQQQSKQQIIAYAEQKRSAYVCVANVHMLIEAYENKRFANVVFHADMVTPDGMPLVWGLRLLHGIRQQRVAGMDLLPALLHSAQAKQLKVFIYGGTNEMLELTIKYIKQKYPALAFDVYSPPFRKLTTQEEDDVAQHINNSGAHLVLVALGCPKQENWMADMKGRILACMVGIGGALPVMVGMQNRAPVWMRNAGLEWLYRLVQEPRRLFKRYAITNTKFIYLLFKAWVAQGFQQRSVKLNNM